MQLSYGTCSRHTAFVVVAVVVVVGCGVGCGGSSVALGLTVVVVVVVVPSEAAQRTNRDCSARFRSSRNTVRDGHRQVGVDSAYLSPAIACVYIYCMTHVNTISTLYVTV